MVKEQKVEKETEKKVEQEVKRLDPTKDAANYIIQVKSGDRIIKRIYAQNSTINVLCISDDQPIAFDIQ